MNTKLALERAVRLVDAAPQHASMAAAWMRLLIRKLSHMPNTTNVLGRILKNIEGSMAANTPEGKVKAKVKALLKKYNCYYFMPVPYGHAGTPDFIACMNGSFIGIETKAGNNKTTKLQDIEHQLITQAGGCVYIVNEDSIPALETLLNYHSVTKSSTVNPLDLRNV